MTSKTTWKNREAFYAEWFDSRRNPLSGQNNRDDFGQKRLGDVLPIHEDVVIEVKLRKNNAVIKRAYETAELANTHNKNWIHIESIKGDKTLTCLVLPTVVCRDIVRNYLRPLWAKPKEAPKDGH